jgi:hypothetical protein
LLSFLSERSTEPFSLSEKKILPSSSSVSSSTDWIWKELFLGQEDNPLQPEPLRLLLDRKERRRDEEASSYLHYPDLPGHGP